MKKVSKRIFALCVCVMLLVASFLTPVAYAATGVYELTFDNLFIFEQWANHSNLRVYTADGTTTSTLTTNISNGSFVLTNNSTNEVFTTFSMDSVGVFYSMPVEENTEYMFSYVANGTTTSFETFVFYFDKSGKFINFETKFAYQYGLNEWSFTTPEGTGYIQVRFDNNSPQTNVTVSDIKIRLKAVYDYAKNISHRIAFTYSAGATYGSLPVPERDGLVFAGWYTGPDGTGEKITSSTVMSSASKCLYSKWEPIVEGDLTVASMPLKQEYCVGEALNTKGLVINVAYLDGTSENIDEGFSCSPTTLTTAGTQTITVSYGGATTTFNVNVKASENKAVSINGAQKTVNCANNTYALNYSGSAFNRYVIKYSSDAYVKGEMTFNNETVEEFFLEPGEDKEFSGYIDGFIGGTTQSSIASISFKSLDKAYMDFTFTAIDLTKDTNPGDSSGMVYLSDSYYKIGIDLDWGGALTYMEDLKNEVYSSVKKTGTKTTEVDFKSNVKTSSLTYNTSKNVNLINAHDTGRLVQQSYYGTGSYPYEPGMYGEAVWNYNPVQGGNLYNQASKIVDIKVTSNEIYIKCRPLDWAKDQQYITPSYMEAWYTLEDGMMRATCRFVDYSDYPSVTTTQELPAFYCVEPLNDFVYYAGGEAWTDNNTRVTRTDLGFWGTATNQDFICNENWAAFKGDDDDSFAIGIYTPGQELYHTGVYYSGDGKTRCSTTSPATEDPTSYIGVVDTLHFQSYTPISYCYYIKTGKVDTIRSSFKTVAQKDTDICDATNTNGFCDMCGKYIAPEITSDKYDIDGNGTKDAVYEISNMGELCWFRDQVNAGNRTTNAVLTCDITDNSGVLTSYGTVASDTSSFRSWTPIGTSTNKYNGHFDGQGHTINGLYMNASTLSYGGLFGYLDSSAVVEKVGVDYSYFNGKQYVGAIAGRNDGKISNCYSCYTVTSGGSYLGGITGYNGKTVENCYSAGIVNANNFVGGIAGENKDTITNCFYLAGAATDGNSQQQNGVGASIMGAATKDTARSAEAKTVEQFASGEVAYYLQNANEKQQLWGQKTNIKGACPIFDTDGAYKVSFTKGNGGNYSLVTIGEIVGDNVLDVSDFQALVNQVLSDEALEYAYMLKSDIDGDGAIDAIDCSLMERLINNNPADIKVYLKGDFDFDGVPFTQEDIAAIKKALINQDRLTTRQKYACDLNSDGILDVNDRDVLTQQDGKSIRPVFSDMETVMGSRNTIANVIILCGQSNAYGASPLTQAVRDTVGNTDFSNIKIKYNNINTSDNVNWQTMFSNNSFETFRLGIGGQADAWFGPELGVAYHLATNADTKDETWYIIKYTAAGTFLGGDWLYDTTGKYYNENNHANIYNSLGCYLADGMVEYVNGALTEIENKHGRNVNIRSFMWMQGESDALVQQWANQYGELQNLLVNRVRTEFEGRDKDSSIGFVDGAIAAYDSTSYYNALTNANQSRNMWVYSDTVNTTKANNASLWYVPANTSKNVINKTTAGLYNNTSSSTTKLEKSIWIDTSTCVSKLVNNNENGEYDGAHYCGDSMLRLGIWFAQGMLQVSNYY